MIYKAAKNRYDTMTYNRCGNSGLKLPAISLGLWHNFGKTSPLKNARALARQAFDRGITHFDLANNYGPPYGSAETTFGIILKKDLLPYRDELIVSSKAGYDMWPGPYGDFGSRKYLIASCDASLKRMGLEYVDIFYHHRPDPETPLEETMGALAQIVKSGKALYVGISNYNHTDSAKAAAILRELKTPFIINQSPYNMFNREIENGLVQNAENIGMGIIVFCPLAQGLLTDKYLKGIPDDSRAVSGSIYFSAERVEKKKIDAVRKLNELAKKRGQTMAQLALTWVLRHTSVVSALIGASKTSQIVNCVDALKDPKLSPDELKIIDTILKTV